MAQQPNIISVPFASNGAKNTIPQTTTTLGKASLSNGFPTETSMPIADGGVPPQRADFNGMLYWLSTFAMYQQAGGKFTYNATIDYDSPAIIFYSGDLWWCKQTNGPSTVVKTPGSDTNYWIKLRDYLANPLAAYPVGAYYISSESTSPATLFGGTWEQVQDMFILAAGTRYTTGTTANPRTGGSSTKQLRVANIPSHTHTFTTQSAGNHVHNVGGTTQSAGAHTHGVSGTVASNGNHTHGVSGDTAETGSHTHGVSGNSASAGTHTHGVSGDTAQTGAHTHSVSGNTAETGAHTHSVSGTSGSAGAHTHGVSGNTGSTGDHSHTRGSMNITGTFGTGGDTPSLYRDDTSGAFSNVGTNGHKFANGNTDDDRTSKVAFDASTNWTGNTSVTGAHTHTINITSGSAGSHSHSISFTSGSNGNHKHSISVTSGSSGDHKHGINLTSASAGSHVHSISLTSASNGNHKHSISLTSATNGAHTHTYSTTSASAGSHTHVIDMTIGQAGLHTHNGTTNATGNGTAFDIMPPYIVAYVWRRTK